MWFSLVAALVAGQSMFECGIEPESMETPEPVALLAHIPERDFEPPAPLLSLDFGHFAEPRRFGEKGSRRWQVHGGYGFAGASNHFGLVGVGVNTFLIDRVSLDAEFNGLFFHQRGVDAAGANLNLLFRWHFYVPESDKWSTYLEVGAGMMLSTDRVPADGTRFNFTPQIGGGASYDLGNDTRLMAGLRWHHISNANIYASNPGRDSIFGYVGVSFGF